MAQFSMRQINRVTYGINGSAIAIHRRFGPGLFESVFHKCMEIELRERGFKFRSKETVPLVYKGTELDAAFEFDLFVEGLVVVELKCVKEIAPIHEAQLLTYMKLMDAPVGLLINFNVPAVAKGGISRLSTPITNWSTTFTPPVGTSKSPHECLCASVSLRLCVEVLRQRRVR